VSVPVTLSIKNVPDELAERLRRRAEQMHRSMQGELMAILETALEEQEPLQPSDLIARLRQLDLRTPAEAVADIRRDRDGR
jgi:plasmid stability protein